MSDKRRNMLDTRSTDAICESLAGILGIRKEAVEVFLAKAMPDYVGRQYWEIDAGIFYDYFNLDRDVFVLDEVMFYHVTTRLSKQNLGAFRIDNLQTVLLSDNPMTQLCKKHDVLFRLEDGIAVYYGGEKVSFEKPLEARLRNRLDKVKDSCVNGFLFPEMMDDSYIGLTGMPEIFSDIMTSIGRRDIQQEYFDKKTCYLATVATKLEKLIFDGIDPKISCQEKTQKFVQYLLCYIGYKKTMISSCMENPMVRLADSYCVPPDEIVDIREIHDWREIFEH